MRKKITKKRAQKLDSRRKLTKPKTSSSITHERSECATSSRPRRASLQFCERESHGEPVESMASPVVSHSELTNKQLLKRIQKCIDEKIRPFINMDGGEIELVELTEKNVLKVRMYGACEGCMAADYTLKFGVQAALDEAFPDEDIFVELINEF